MSNIFFLKPQNQLNFYLSEIENPQSKNKESLIKEVLLLISEVPYDLNPIPSIEEQLKASELLENFNYKKSSLLLNSIKKTL